MRPISVLALLFAAAPAIAHEGAHVHPHADSPVWLSLLAAALVAAAATVVIRGFK
ncbi:peptidase M23 [Shimia biformata]|uniref:peptidase M23 n=1 Tax=Shimia biformata TaxID=1294299 RepID=UPI0019516487|nr:peptidase M23 [Shimia biformata]